MSNPSLQFTYTNGSSLSTIYDFGTVSAGATQSGSEFLLWNLKGTTGITATSVEIRVMDSGGASQTDDVASEGWIEMCTSGAGAFTTMSSGASVAVGNIASNASVHILHRCVVPSGETDPSARTFVYRADYTFA